MKTMIVNKPVISSRIFNCLLQLIISTFQHTPFPLLRPYSVLTCTLSTYERSNLNYLKHLHNALYIQKSVRFLAGYSLAFSTPSLERASGASQDLSPSKLQLVLALTEWAGAEAPFPNSAAVGQTLSAA